MKNIYIDFLLMPEPAHRIMILNDKTACNLLLYSPDLSLNRTSCSHTNHIQHVQQFIPHSRRFWSDVYHAVH